MWTFPVYYNDCVSFNCPVCRIEHTFLHQNKENKEPVQPKRIIAKVYVGDKFGRDAKSQMFKQSELYCLILKKYKEWKPCDTYSDLRGALI